MEGLVFALIAALVIAAFVVPLLGTLKQFREGIPRVVFDLYGPRASG